MVELAKLLKEKGLVLNSRQQQQFETYFQLLVSWNKKVNLTAITDREEVIIKHFYDSLTPSFFYAFADNASICDVGSGAGFPVIPLKIMFPTLKVTIVDSLNKRLLFLEEVKKQLHLEGVSLIHDRAETFAHLSTVREQFDWVVARAVANLTVLCEYCLPLVRKGGSFLALKGGQADEEVQQASAAIRILGGILKQQCSIELPENCGSRLIVQIDKEHSTPNKYPRKPGLPAKKPLFDSCST
ncbi:MAG: 16S rRNA (guanine(527)-N(7))-methyltransferase RsmG [Sporolactobacillus sp.]